MDWLNFGKQENKTEMQELKDALVYLANALRAQQQILNFNGERIYLDEKELVSEGVYTVASIGASAVSKMVDKDRGKDYIDCSKGKYLSMQLRCTFNGAATNGANVNLYAGQDFINFDTQSSGYEFVAAIVSPVSAGNSRTKSSGTIDVRAKRYIQVYIINNDIGQALTNCVLQWSLWK